MFKDMKKNYSSPFHWEQNSRRRVLTAVWGIHVIIRNSFFRQKFWCIFFRNSLLKEGCRSIFLKASKLKCFLISLVWLKHYSLKYIQRKMTTFAKFLRPTDTQIIVSTKLLELRIRLSIIKMFFTLLSSKVKYLHM